MEIKTKYNIGDKVFPVYGINSVTNSTAESWVHKEREIKVIKIQVTDLDTTIIYCFKTNTPYFDNYTEGNLFPSYKDALAEAVIRLAHEKALVNLKEVKNEISK